MRKAFSSILAGAVVVAMSTPGFSQFTNVEVFRSTSITTAKYVEYHAPSGKILLGAPTGVTAVDRINGANPTVLAGFGSGTLAGLAVSESTGAIVAAKTDGTLVVWSSVTDAAPNTAKSIPLGTIITGNVHSIDIAGSVVLVSTTNPVGAGRTADVAGFNINGAGSLPPVLGWLTNGGPYTDNVGVAGTEDLSTLWIGALGVGGAIGRLEFNPTTLTSSYSSVTADFIADGSARVTAFDTFDASSDTNVAWAALGGFGRVALDGDSSSVAAVGYAMPPTPANNEIRYFSTGNGTIQPTEISASLAFSTGLAVAQNNQEGDVVAFSVPASVTDWSLF